MKNRIYCAAAMLFGFLSATSSAQAASFNCAKAATPIERMICSDPALSHYDERLNIEYKSELESSSNRNELAIEQRKWLKEVRDSCKEIQCLLNAYAERIEALALQPEDESEFMDFPIIVGCNKSTGNMLIQGASQSGQSYFKTHGYRINELKWDDLLIYGNKSPSGETTYRRGSKTRAQSCGSYKVEIEYGYENDDPMGYHGYERFPQISVQVGSKTIIDSLPIGHDSIFSKCPDGNPMRLFVYSTHIEALPKIYIERTCFDDTSEKTRRNVLIQY